MLHSRYHCCFLASLSQGDPGKTGDPGRDVSFCFLCFTVAVSLGNVDDPVVN